MDDSRDTNSGTWFSATPIAPPPTITPYNEEVVAALKTQLEAARKAHEEKIKEEEQAEKEREAEKKAKAEADAEAARAEAEAKRAEAEAKAAADKAQKEAADELAKKQKEIQGLVKPLDEQTEGTSGQPGGDGQAWGQGGRYGSGTESPFAPKNDGGSGGSGRSVTGHFTALVWKTTYKLGCAYKDCWGSRPGTTLVCQYEPMGNWGGQYTSNVMGLKSRGCSSSADSGYTNMSSSRDDVALFGADTPRAGLRSEVTNASRISSMMAVTALDPVYQRILDRHNQLRAKVRLRARSWPPQPTRAQV